MEIWGYFNRNCQNYWPAKGQFFLGHPCCKCVHSHTHWLSHTHTLFLLNVIFFLLDSSSCYFLLPTFALFLLKQLEVELQQKLINARILMITATKCTLTFEVRDEELMMFSDKSERCCPLKAWTRSLRRRFKPRPSALVCSCLTAVKCLRGLEVKCTTRCFIWRPKAQTTGANRLTITKG